MYSNTEAEIRPELQAVVEEAFLADKYFIAQNVYPLWMTKSKYGEFRRIKKSSGQLLASDLGDSTVRAPRTAYKEVDRTYEKDRFFCVDRGLTEVVDDADALDINRFFDAESTSAKLVQRNMAISYEKRVAESVFNPSVWGTQEAAVEYTEANIAALDVAQDIENAIARVQKRGEMVNAIVLSRNVWKRIRRSTLLRKFLYGDLGGGQSIDKAQFAKAFSESAQVEVLIAESTYSTAKKGSSVTDANLAYVWGDSYIWVGNVTGGDPNAGGAGRTMVWEEDASSLFVVETYRDEPRRSDVIRVRQHTDEKVINENAGTLITTGYVD